jgi:hypothetical protein
MRQTAAEIQIAANPRPLVRAAAGGGPQQRLIWLRDFDFRSASESSSMPLAKQNLTGYSCVENAQT